MAAFYLDGDVTHDIAAALRQDGHAATTAPEHGLKTAPDDEQLLTLAGQGRIEGRGPG